MYKIKEWRGFDLTHRYAKFEKALARERVSDAAELPIVAYCPSYFCSGTNRPPSYFTDPEVMLRIQADGAQRHLELVDDDFIPYFMPWFGTGVLASAFGCGYRYPTGPNADPAVTSCAVTRVEDIAKLKVPDPEKDAEMSRVLRCIDYVVKSGEMPVGLSDMNSPLSTAAQICGYDRFFMWLYDEPDAIHELMEKTCEAFVRWTKIQKEHIGEPLDGSNGLQGLWAPKGLGVWLSDDDLVSISADHYEEFVAPHYSRFFKEFGGASIHFCGKAPHQIKGLAQVENCVEINNSPMGGFDEFAQILDAFQGKKLIGIQDTAPEDPEAYYAELFSRMHSLDGLAMILWVSRYHALNLQGGTINLERDEFETANRVVRAIRSEAKKVLARAAGIG